MSLAYYPCRKCKNEVPVRSGRDIGYCRYCGDELTVTELMKKYQGMTDIQILRKMENIFDLLEVFEERESYDTDAAWSFLKELPKAKDDPTLCFSVYEHICENYKDKLPEKLYQELCIYFLDAAAASKNYENTHFVKANKMLASAYHFGHSFNVKVDKEKAKDYYFTLSKNPEHTADAFFSMYIASEKKEDKDFWLNEAARKGHPMAISRTTEPADIKCAYFNSGICCLKSGTTVTIHCYYFKEGRAMAACPDYKVGI